MIRLKRLYAHNFKQLQQVELYFPASARILVQGRNESGKSTLFEAIFFALFGNALATETGARGLDALIAYETEKARVELDVACGDRLFKIVRTIVRNKSNTWELEVSQEGRAPEEIRGNTAVNKRLVAELGFDGEALLNTCFVEQKKLEKLEGLSRAKREESLAKLLNLDAIVDLENDLKVRAEDKQELEHLKRRSELADIQAELPERQQALQTVESRLKLIDLRRAVEGAAGELQAVQALDTGICTLMAQRDAVAHKAERIDILKEAMLSAKQARDALERCAENTREIERLRAERAEIARTVQDEATLEASGRALARLAHRVQRLTGIRTALEANTQRIAELGATLARVEGLNASIRREEQVIAQTGDHLRARAIHSALADWITARRAVIAQGSYANLVRQKQTERDQIARAFRLQVYGLAGLLLLLVLVATLVQALAPAFIALAILVLVVLAARATALARDLARAGEALGQAQGEAHANAAASEKSMQRLKETEAALAQLDQVIPSDPEQAQARSDEIEREFVDHTDQDLPAELAVAREHLLQARDGLAELQELYAPSGDLPNVLAQDLGKCQGIESRARDLLARWDSRIKQSASDLHVEPTAEAIQRARYQLEAQVEQFQRRIGEGARLEQEIARRQGQTENLIATARESYAHAHAARPDLRVWDASMTADDCTSFGKELRSDYNAIGGEAVVKQARELEGGLGRRQGERETRSRNAGVLVGRTSELLAELGQAGALSESPDLAELAELRDRFATLDLGDEATLRLQHRDLVGRLHSLRDRQAQLERELGLDGQALDRAACRAEYADKTRQTLVRERGVEIVSLARRRIVSKVLPATMDYMRQILPALTRDRYHDAKLDPESYKIQVWDERAGQGGAFKEKNIFSGGTRDQFSLALRLAFALATLPQERGSAPSFIFLDEPLGSFDDERAEALIYLLTEGEIARAFDQIFLISHVHVDERLFTHRVVLESGRVQFTDLPANSP